MPQRYELPNGQRVEAPDEWTPEQVMQAYSAGSFGPVKGYDAPPETTGQTIGKYLKAAVQPGTPIRGAVQSVTGAPTSVPGRAAAWIAEEGLNMLPATVATMGAGSAAAPMGKIGQALARIGTSSGMGAAANPENPGTGALIGGVTGTVGETAAPVISKGLAYSGLIRTPAQRMAQRESKALVPKIAELIEDTPALSSSPGHTDLPSLTSIRAQRGATPPTTAKDVYDIVKGGKGRELLNEVGDAVRFHVEHTAVGNQPLIIMHPMTGHPTAIPFDDAWAARSIASQRSGTVKGAQAHLWGMSKAQWDQQIENALTGMDSTGKAVAAYKAGINIMRPAYALQEFLKSGYAKKGGSVLDANKLREAMNDLGSPKPDALGLSSPTAPPGKARRIVGGLGDLYDRIGQMIGHTPGQEVPTAPLVGPTTQAVVDSALTGTQTGQLAALSSLPYLQKWLGRLVGGHIGGGRQGGHIPEP
jgi:hypothetical protein